MSERAPGRRPRLPALLVLAAAAAAAAAAADPMLAAGHPLLAASTQAGRATVVGTVAATRRIDAHGHAAELRVERALTGSLAAGARQQIAWEELSTSLPPRFAAGERLLVVLEPLPGGSLWRTRFPDGDALAVAAGGRAALAAPDAATLESLARYLGLAADARASAPGAAALLELAAEAAPPIAESALAALAERTDLDPQLAGDDAARSRFAKLVADPARPAELRRAALELAGRRGLASLRPALEPLAHEGQPLEAEARAALALLDGGLAPETARALLERSEPALRSLALRSGGEAIDDARVADAAREDPAPEVRIAAAETLLARRREAALPTALPLLFDPDAEVRREVGLRIAALGEGAVPALRELLTGRPYEEPSELAPVALTLALSGPAGVAALEHVSHEDPDPKRRKLAELALGRFGHRH